MDVRIECACPPKADGEPRHDHDTVTLPDVLDFPTMLTIRQSLRFAVEAARTSGDPMSFAEMTAVMSEAYLLHTIGGWTLVDETDKPIPPSKAAIRAFMTDHFDAAEHVADAADDLYSEKVVLPLLQRASNSSPATSTPVSTSPKPNGKTSRKPSRRSSTTTSMTDAIAATDWSPGGVYSSSQS